MSENTEDRPCPYPAGICEETGKIYDALDRRCAELEAQVEELKQLNLRAKDVLEKTLDCEASASVARNRLEIEVKSLTARNKRMEAALLSISKNTCCSKCQEAQLVASKALRDGEDVK